MQSSLLKAGALSSATLACLGLGGCAHDRGSYEVLKEARSPNGDLLAQLVRHQSHAALSSDTYFAVLSHDRLDEGSLRLADHQSKRPFLEVTRGWELRFHWKSPTALEVECDACGLEKIDVMEKRYTVNNVSISYSGFPLGTAYSDK